MRLNEKYKIESIDERCLALKERIHSNKHGRYTYKNVAYFGNIQEALKYLIKKEINCTGLKNLKVINAKIEELKEYIDLYVK